MNDSHRDEGHSHVGGHEVDESPFALSPHAARVIAAAKLLVEAGVLTRDEIDHQLTVAGQRNPADGAWLVARAWVDADFRALLRSDFKSAVRQLGLDASGKVEFAVVENGPRVHHIVVCTLCSCYPRAILGSPPDWYKSTAYRSRAIREPRVVLSEFGVELADDVHIEVHDSTADLRYLVLPSRPEATEHLTENELAQLVSRDALIGVAVPRYRPERPAGDGEL